MHIINSRVHGILDYATVIFLLIAPVIFKMDYVLGFFTYALGLAQLLLSVMTAYEWGIFKKLPFRIHGSIELALGSLLILIAFFFRHAVNNLGFYFYLVGSGVYLLVFFLTDFRTLPAVGYPVAGRPG